MNKTKIITRTAILLALTIVFQSLGRFIPLGANSNFVVGPLVNACLIIATLTTSVWAGILISILAPIGALLTGAVLPLPFIPVIAIGNSVLVLAIYFLSKKNFFVGLIIGAIVKFGVLFASISVLLKLLNIPAKKAQILLFSFGWPQLVTAVIGGIIAYIVLKLLPKSIDRA